LSSLAHIIGVVVSETRSETRIATDKVNRELAEKPSDDAAHEEDRGEHRHQRDADREDGGTRFRARP